MQFRNNASITALLFSLFTILGQPLKAGETCPTNSSGPDICVAFDSGTPVLGTHFTVDYLTDPSNPSVVLKTGSLTWNVRSTATVGLGDIGDITLDPTVSTDNFKVKIATGASAGAANVKSIDLSAGSWTGYSSIETGSKVTGDVTGGLTVTKDSGGSGGIVDGLTILGNLEGDVTIPVLKSMTVDGRIGEVDANPTVYSVDIATLDTGILKIGSIRNVEITIDEVINGGKIEYHSAVDDDNQTLNKLDILDVSGCSGSLITAGNPSVLFLEQSEMNIKIHDDLPSGCNIDMSEASVEGGLAFADNVPNYKTVSGNITIGEGNFWGASMVNLAGTLTVNEDINGIVTIEGNFGNASPGTIDIGGAVPDLRTHIVIKGDLGPYAKINVTGDVINHGDIWIEGDLAGEIDISGDTVAADSILVLGEVIDTAAHDEIYIGGNADAGPIFYDAVHGQIIIDGDVNDTVEFQDNLNGTFTVNGNVNELIDITGDLKDTLSIGGDLAATGDIVVAESVSGDIEIAGDCDGNITIADVVKGDIDIEGAMNGSVSMEALTSNGRILIAGLVDGAIRIDDKTESGTLIDLDAGIDDNGSVTINDDRGNFDADGQILIGTSKDSPVTFDGYLAVYDSTGGTHGDLNNHLVISGCHDTADDLDICICGSGSATLDQAGSCTYTVTDSCISGCP
jgi:hypothetical protein